MSSYYVYPFGPKATTGRIDQGQDFGGTGNILAIGRARIIRLGAPGWPGGKGVLYRLLEGPMAGHNVFVNEGIMPVVKAGQIVKAGQPIGRLIPGSSTGIEIGWADRNGVPISHSEYTEGKETVGGKSMAQFLAGLKSGGGGNLPEDVFNAAAGVYNDAVTEPLIAGGKAVAGLVGEGASAVGQEVVSAIVGDLTGSAGPLLLNIALIGGAAGMIFYGIALAAGVEQPAKRLAGAAAKTAEVATAVAPK